MFDYNAGFAYTSCHARGFMRDPACVMTVMQYKGDPRTISAK